MTISLPITVLKGIGEKRAKEYHRLGIDSVRDMIEFYPRAYEISKGSSRAKTGPV